MDILKIGILGIMAVLLALMLKKYHVEYSSYISIAVCICIFTFAAVRLELLIGYAKKMQTLLHVNDTYMSMILKMIGITYVTEFAANICKDSGYQTIAGQIELFAKLSILLIGMPVILACMESIGELL
ncbi:stage III sporulation AC/AD family protein [Roseburia sp. BX1005]|uniref:Stage III sporulation AC/AD family protein n=1 Tax=Roseburia zhanii TaxID=2763064 RepID=A0A923RTF8_9FIRM|nr:stage III sporulation AC/AD family protein [Roseburia zhanii]MBC5714638.1 stage III sporulation AC/AD family protein [Roseburia zhanii]OLA93017.1 MAG: stage III sporulation protein AD [Roseburia sp. 40_7]